MNSNFILPYITERYGNFLCKQYRDNLVAKGIELFEFPFGFFTAEGKGDAYIVHDLYVAPEFRRKQAHECAWKLFEAMREKARQLHKNVMIGFSEFEGQNQELGRIAMKTAGFQKAFETDLSEVYIRGVQ